MNKTFLFILIIIIFSFKVYSYSVITPIPQKIKFDREKAILGKKLFFEKRLSKDEKINCASCHNLNFGGTINKKFPKGVFGIIDPINSPTVFNAVFNFRQNWNGNAKNLVEQAKLALLNPKEMGMTEIEIINKLKSIPEYMELFKKIYKTDNIKLEYVVNAIAEFEKTLITPNSKFNKFLQNKTNLTINENKGYELFKTLGCITCHNGVNLGGNSFQKIGVINEMNRTENTPDLYKITSDPLDKNVFKVPTLNNIELTYPYFHDGSANTLEDAIEKMGLYNLGIKLNKDEIENISSFLKTLTGDNINLIK